MRQNFMSNQKKKEKTPELRSKVRKEKANHTWLTFFNLAKNFTATNIINHGEVYFMVIGINLYLYYLKGIYLASLPMF